MSEEEIKPYPLWGRDKDGSLKVVWNGKLIDRRKLEEILFNRKRIRKIKRLKNENNS